jgi:hypothetical protein
MRGKWRCWYKWKRQGSEGRKQKRGERKGRIPNRKRMEEIPRTGIVPILLRMVELPQIRKVPNRKRMEEIPPIKRKVPVLATVEILLSGKLIRKVRVHHRMLEILMGIVLAMTTTEIPRGAPPLSTPLTMDGTRRRMTDHLTLARLIPRKGRNLLVVRSTTWP